MLDKYMSNPVISSSLQSLEKEEMKEHYNINKLFKLNLRKIVRNKLNKNKLDIYCIAGKMYYAK
jgi:hypothetical protein